MSNIRLAITFPVLVVCFAFVIVGGIAGELMKAALDWTAEKR